MDDHRDGSRARAVAETLPDIIAPGLSVLFCGINPGMQAVARGQHFAGRGNRFWRTIHLAGFTAQQIPPDQDHLILRYQCGLTSVVERPTARADLLTCQDFSSARGGFERKVGRYRPCFVAFLGKAAYAALSGLGNVGWGPQLGALMDSAVWVLPNPSGRNRAFSLDGLVDAYRALHVAAHRVRCSARSIDRTRSKRSPARADGSYSIDESSP